MKTVSSVLALGASLLLAVVVSAADQETPTGEKPHGDRPQGERRHGPAGGMDILRMLKAAGVELTADQKAKVEEVQKEFRPKMQAVQQKHEGILTDEQKKARAEAMKAVRESGKKWQEARKAVEDAVKLTDEQKAKMADVQKEMGELRKETHEKVMAILTPEQQEQLKKKMAEGRKPREEKAKDKESGKE